MSVGPASAGQDLARHARYSALGAAVLGGFRSSAFWRSCGFFLCLLTAVAADETSVIKNGDFQSGNQYWKGDGTVVTLPDGNRVGQIKASDRRFQMLEIEFELGELNEMEVRFQARYTGTNRKMRVKVETRGQGALMYSFDLPEDGSWMDCKFNHIRKPGVKKFDAVFQALLGEGTLQIDNVWGGKPGTYKPPNATPATNPPPAPPPTPPGMAPKPAVVAPAPLPPPQPISTTPALPVPAGVMGSPAAIIDSVPAADLQEMLSPATAQGGLQKVNAFLKERYLRQPAQFEFVVDVAEVKPDNLVFRIRDQAGGIETKNGQIPLRMIWAYFKDTSGFDPKAIKPGQRLTIGGTMSRCDFVIADKGARFCVDLANSRIINR